MYKNYYDLEKTKREEAIGKILIGSSFSFLQKL